MHRSANMKRKAPSNNDPVCRLQGIANGLSKCLNENRIYTVADFLRASEEDPEKLQHVSSCRSSHIGHHTLLIYLHRFTDVLVLIYFLFQLDAKF